MSRTYIPCVLTSTSTRKVKELLNQRTTRPFGKVTKAALREAVRVDELTTESWRLEFQSQSIYHRPGSYFTIPEAVKVYGPSVGLQVRDEDGHMVAMIESDFARDSIKTVIR